MLFNFQLLIARCVQFAIVFFSPFLCQNKRNVIESNDSKKLEDRDNFLIYFIAKCSSAIYQFGFAESCIMVYHPWNNGPG